MDLKNNKKILPQFFVLQFHFGRCADADPCYTTGERGDPFLGFFFVKDGVQIFHRFTNGGNAGVDGVLVLACQEERGTFLP